MTVGRDFRMTGRSVTLGFSIGDEEACAGNGSPPITVGHDLVVTGNSALSGFFSPSSLDVGNNSVGHDLIFSGNTAVPGGYLAVSDNSVGHDAICAANSPALSKDDPGDGPNLAGQPQLRLSSQRGNSEGGPHSRPPSGWGSVADQSLSPPVL
jgi:hypothetical protein